MSHRPDVSPPKGPDSVPDDRPPSLGPSMEGHAETKAAVGEQGAGPPRASADRVSLWFEDTVVVPDEFRELLVQYSHIPPDEVDEHIIRVVSMGSSFFYDKC